MIANILRERASVDKQRIYDYIVHKDVGIPSVYVDQLKFI
jgi:hypothetical protein